MMSNQGGYPIAAPDYPEAESPRPRTLEDQLASVIEGDGVLYVGDGMSLLVRPTTVDVSKKRCRRKRIRTARSEAAALEAGMPEMDDRIRLEDPERVSVGLRSMSEQAFRIVSIPIRQAEHARSPFVVSLRGIAFSIEPVHPEDTIPQSEIFAIDVPSEAGVPSLDILEALAADLAVDDSDAHGCAEQFTPATFSASYASMFGPVGRFFDGVNSGFERLRDLFPAPRARSRRERAPESEEPEIADLIPRPRRRVPIARTAALMGGLALVAALPGNAVRLIRTLETQKTVVTSEGRNALGDLQSAAGGTLEHSIGALESASERFRRADESLSKTNTLALALANVVPQTRSSLASGRALLEVGAKSSEAARLLAKGLDQALSGKGGGVLDRLGVMAAYADGALPLLDEASQSLATVRPDAIPEDERAKLADISAGLDAGRLAVREFVGVAELASRLLGRDEPKRFLIMFQNPNELRPTGGFMGSYAELDLDRGTVKRLTIPGGGTYDVQGQLTTSFVPPEPLQLVADRWEFQDANWSPDFPTAANDIRMLWSKSGGYTVDGVIAVNATVVADLLKITGPVDVPELGKTLTAENAMDEIQKSAEFEYDRTENKPKKILSLAAPRLIEKLRALEPSAFANAVNLLSDAIERKDIQIALTNEDDEVLAEGLGWNGRMKETSGDAFALIDANVAGGKTDAVLREEVTHAAAIAEDGSIVDTVTVVRTHEGMKHAPLTGVRNVAYVRAYVPRGSTLLFAEGFATSPRALLQEPREDAIPNPDDAATQRTKRVRPGDVTEWEEGNRTVFGGWSLVDPGQKVVLTLKYRLPFSAFEIRNRLVAGTGAPGDETGRAAYTLLLTSQSGTPRRTISSKVEAPATWTEAWSRNWSGNGAVWDRDGVVSTLYTVKGD